MAENKHKRSEEERGGGVGKISSTFDLQTSVCVCVYVVHPLWIRSPRSRNPVPDAKRETVSRNKSKQLYSMCARLIRVQHYVVRLCAQMGIFQGLEQCEADRYI